MRSEVLVPQQAADRATSAGSDQYSTNEFAVDLSIAAAMTRVPRTGPESGFVAAISVVEAG